MLLDVCENRAGHAALSPLSRKPACIVCRYKIESEFLIPKTLKGSPQCTLAVGRHRGAWSSPELAPAWFWVQPRAAQPVFGWAAPNPSISGHSAPCAPCSLHPPGVPARCWYPSEPAESTPSISRAAAHVALAWKLVADNR